MTDPINRIPVGDHIDPAPYGYHPGTNIPRKRPEPAFEGKCVCKNCGQAGLVWERQGERWTLCAVGGKKHECPKGMP